MEMIELVLHHAGMHIKGDNPWQVWFDIEDGTDEECVEFRTYPEAADYAKEHNGEVYGYDPEWKGYTQEIAERFAKADVDYGELYTA